MNSQPSTLRELCLQITNSCPLRCLHCSTRGGPRLVDELSTEEIERVIVDFEALGGRVIELSGGEPLAHPDFLRLVRAARSLGLEVRIYTSGVTGYGSNGAVPAPGVLWQKLGEDGPAKVFFNVQGPDRVTHETITRIPGSFPAVLESIEQASAAGLFVGIHFVPMRPNYERTEETILLARDCGVDEFAVLRFVPQGRGLDNKDTLLLSHQQFAQFLEKITRIKREVSSPRIRLGCPFNHRALFGDIDVSLCGAGVTVCHVRPTGEVMPCSAFQQRYVVLGNVRDTPLYDLFLNGVSWQRFRELHSRGPPPGSVDFILESRDACLAQIASGSERPLDASSPPREHTHQVQEAQ